MEILALFDDVEAAASGVERILAEGMAETSVTSLSAVPVPPGVLVSEPPQGAGPVRAALAGGIAGAVLGAALAGGTAWLYPLYTGDKPIISLFPAGIITYEFAMLFAIVGAVAGMFAAMGWPMFRRALYDPAISEGRVGILVTCRGSEEAEQTARALRAAGGTLVDGETP